MANSVFPVTKLVYLVVKQASKPISRNLADWARSSSVFRRRIIFPLGRFVHKMQVWLKMKEMGLKGKITKIPKMGDDKISEMGSQVLAEMILITMVGSFLVAVYLSQGDDLSSEDDVEEEELSEMRRRLEKLDNTFDTQQEALDQLENNINLFLARLERED